MPTLAGFVVHLADNVEETTQTTGTGTYTLDGAITGRRAFQAAISSGLRTVYKVELGSNWEITIGTVTSGAPATLSRDSVRFSSNNGNPVSWPPGIKRIFQVDPAEVLSQITEKPMISRKVTVFTDSGTWTRDPKCVGAWVRGAGNGGAGGGCQSTSPTEAAEGAGGGAGGYVEGYFTASALGPSRVVTIPAAAQGVDGGAGNDGGNVTFGSLMTCGGGGGGGLGNRTTTNAVALAGAGGAGNVGGDIQIRGGDGFYGRVINSQTGPIPSQHCQGGGGVLSGAQRPPGGNNPGTSGQLYGGGGTGAINGSSQSNRTGGDGARGIVIIIEDLHP